MFRLQNNVPEVYVDKSRDFQLFCRLYDLCFSGVKFSIDSLSRSTSTKECDSSILELLKTKLGLFTSIEVDDTELRYLLQAFPIIMRYKGSKQGLEYIKILYTKMYPNVSTPEVQIRLDYTVRFIFSEPPKNDKLLLELLRYVLPTGYLVSYDVAETQQYRTLLTSKDVLEYEAASDTKTFSQLGEIAPDSDATSDKIDSELGAIVGLSMISDEETNNEWYSFSIYR